MAFLFKKLDQQLLNETKANWIGLLQNGEETFSPSGYFHFLDWAQARLSDNEAWPFSHCFAVVDDSSTGALALFEICIAQKGQANAWLKILAMRTTPKFDFRNAESEGDTRLERTRSVAKVISFGLAETLKMTNEAEFAASKLKIFANKQVDKALFREFADSLEKGQEKAGVYLFELASYGQWLEIKKQ